MKHYLILFFIFNIFTANAQLQTSSGWQTYDQIVEDLLFDYADDVSNVTYTGWSGAIGTFNGVNTTLGIDRGVIMTTGTIYNDSAGPHGPNDLPNAGVDNLKPGYAPLSDLIGTETFNAAVLECDFVASTDSVKLDYVFGSEEYPEFVNTQFNDGFAFFISGPGITDTINMATAVSINTVNNINFGSLNDGPCTNCEYYVINGDGGTEPYNFDEQYIQYDGYTTPLTSFSVVEPGETYHLTIVIADAGDEMYDSGLFLKTNNQEAKLTKHDVSQKIKLYPNPNQGSFIIESTKEEESENIEIYGADGKKVAFNIEKLNAAESKIEIKELKQGVYWVKIFTKEGDFYSSKFIID